jgi:mono/diheme cytochrome c family protein
MKSVWHRAALGLCAAVAAAASSQAAPAVSFKNDVLPIFQNHCAMCHGPGGVGNASAGLDLTSYKQLRAGSLGGVAVIPFHPERSPLVKTIKDNWTSNKPGALKMPPTGAQLSSKEIDTISTWIKQGAKNN